MTGTADAGAGAGILHATCIAVDGRGLLLLGPSGAGKSALALRMIALGAQLVSDDRTRIISGPDGPLALCPAEDVAGLIEARGIGILRAPHCREAVVRLAVDLSQTEEARLPPHRSITLAGHVVDLVLRSQNDHFPAALMLYLQRGRVA